jgi:hypothetical protein
LLKELASLSLEIAQLVVADEGSNGDGTDPLPSWLLVEIVRDLPRLIEKRDGGAT